MSSTILRLMRAATFDEVPVRVLSPFAVPISETVERFKLGERTVLCAFMATIAHESDSFKATREYHDGSRYENRADLGNVPGSGDGKRFPGRSLIMVTGRENSQRSADFFGLSLDEWCTWAETPEGAALVAGWYFAWYRPECVRAALAGDFPRVCRIVGGNPPNGMKDRTARYIETMKAWDAEHASAGRWPK